MSSRPCTGELNNLLTFEIVLKPTKKPMSMFAGYLNAHIHAWNLIFCGDGGGGIGTGGGGGVVGRVSGITYNI